MRRLCRKVRGKTYERMYLPLYTLARENDSEDEEVPMVRVEEPSESAVETPTRRITYRAQRVTRLTVVILPIIVFWSLLSTVYGCSEITTLTAKTDSCIPKNGVLNCKITDITRLSLVPSGQEACMLIKTPLNEPIGTVKIEAKSIDLLCDKRNVFFTRSFQMKTQASKRCASAGSCTGTTCENTKPDTVIKELEGMPYEHPGFSYCRDSCGCLSCGCFLCAEGCLFYRVFAVPSSPTVFEVFDCPVWQDLVVISVTLHTQNESRAESLSLRQGVGYTWKNMKFTITSISKPSVPLLSTKFISDGRRTVLKGGQPSAGELGQLQCSTRSDAECYMSLDSCVCE